MVLPIDWYRPWMVRLSTAQFVSSQSCNLATSHPQGFFEALSLWGTSILPNDFLPNHQQLLHRFFYVITTISHRCRGKKSTFTSTGPEPHSVHSILGQLFWSVCRRKYIRLQWQGCNDGQRCPSRISLVSQYEIVIHSRLGKQ